MEEEVSRKAVLVLVLVAVLVSIFSTVLVLNTVYNQAIQSDYAQVDYMEPNGKVSLTVPQQPLAGRVTLIVKNDQEVQK